MLQLFINHADLVLSHCYLKAFRFKEGTRIDIYWGGSKNSKMGNLFTEGMTILHSRQMGLDIGKSCSLFIMIGSHLPIRIKQKEGNMKKILYSFIIIGLVTLFASQNALPAERPKVKTQLVTAPMGTRAYGLWPV